MRNQVTQAAQYLGEFLGSSRGMALRKFSSPKMPYWAKEAAHLYQLPVGDTLVILADLAPTVGFDQAVNLYRTLAKLNIGPVLLLADSLPTKARGVLVRMKVPHLLSSGAIYAPELGISYRARPAAEVEKKTEFREKLLPIAQKLTAAHLLKFTALKGALSLTEIRERLEREKFEVSLSTLSRAVQQLEHFGLVRIEGKGPQKRATFLERELLWPRLLELDTETVLKRILLPELPPQKAFWVFSGDSALARLSELNEPESPTIAMALSAMKKWRSQMKPGAAIENRCTVEVWRGSPLLLAKNRCLNPIELALSMRRSRDPRVQIAVTEILEREGLDAKHLWERE